MPFLLSDQNVSTYLVERGIQNAPKQSPSEIKLRACKNFNLSVRFPEGQHFLVKQECHNAQGKTRGEVAHEWAMHQFLAASPELHRLKSVLPESLDFDPNCSILVSLFFEGYCDLDDWYGETERYDPAIAQSLAIAIATLHRATYQVASYKDFLTQVDPAMIRPPQFTQGLEGLRPEIFGQLCTDALEFFRLYQRYDSLRQAIAHLPWHPCCLIHKDLKLSNVIVERTWAEALNDSGKDLSSVEDLDGKIRIIDWERFAWGDPAFDVATILASYLKYWLGSLMMGKGLDLDLTLRLAATPLESLQPSLITVMQTYLQQFPEVVQHDPTFLDRTMQFTGLCLIRRILAKLEYREPFGNSGICLMQVAKSLLCQPTASIPAIFGVTEFDIS